ncbi:AAA family ATPase [Psychrobacter piechaudii]|uniref:Putative frv operon regulatory protein n=1 Tax=Psychrobacter piechaudii TaxID=1945521 RepID=A0A1R4GWH5_9GAMM|nr:AAA family ATPase [Psychrobacter piechaudii]SJM72464.1 putative frv operon regulatory protein [Psychrobacter piechaudii]
MKQATALDILKTGKNVFLTGSAGSGKTYTLNEYIHYLRARRVPVATTASTGIAATHMNGITIHSWSGIGIKDELSERDLANLSRKKILKDRLRETAVLIIDEISMLHAKQLNAVNQVLKHMRQSEEPFGGIQLVVAGDFFQLPPVGNRGETNREKFAFMSEAWLEAGFKICYLSEQHRQNTDEEENAISLDNILNQIRGEEGVSFEAIEALQNTFYQDVDINRTRLFTHNVNVNKINEHELALLNGETVTYNAIAHGDNKLVETLKKSVRTSDELTLKVGAKVMFIKNNNELGVSNGTMGELVGFTTIKPLKSSNDHSAISEDSESDDLEAETTDIDIEETDETIVAIDGEDESESTALVSTDRYPVIKLNNGRQVIAEGEEWVVEDENGEILASYTQIPLTLAWAITIHKSQGMTLDAAEIDLSKTFELGQGYVALSRLKSLEGLKLLGMNDLSLRLDPLARGADARFKVLSCEAEQTFEKIKSEVLEESHERFVLVSGGTLNKAYIEAFEKSLKSRKKKQAQMLAQKDKLSNQLNDHSDSTLMATKLLLEESLTIAEIAEARGLAQATIMGHVARLKRQYPELNCEHLRPDVLTLDKVSEAVEAIVAAADPNDFQEGSEDSSATADRKQDINPFSKDRIKLRPIYEYLKEQIDYNTIRLALIFID